MKGATILLLPANEVYTGYVFTFCSQGGLQVHTQRGCWGVWLGSPGPHPGGMLGDLVMGSPGPHPGGGWGGLAGGGAPGPHPGGSGGGDGSQHALRQTSQQTATAAGGRHPTGMHSCIIWCYHTVLINLNKII